MADRSSWLTKAKLAKSCFPELLTQVEYKFLPASVLPK